MEKRHATRPYYTSNPERDYLLATLTTFLVGAMLGAVITLGVLS